MPIQAPRRSEHSQFFTIARDDLESIYGAGLIGRATAAAAILYNPAAVRVVDELRTQSFLVDALARVTAPQADTALVLDVEAVLDGVAKSFETRVKRESSGIELNTLLMIVGLILTFLTFCYQRASYLNDLETAPSQEAATKAL